MGLHFRRQEDKLIIFGQTYPVKEAIKAMGGRFNGAAKNWFLPFSEDNLSRVKDLCGEGAEQAAKQAPEQEDTPPPLVKEPSRTGASWDTQTAKNLRPDALSLREVMDKAAIAVTSAFPTPLWVIGEIENVSRRGDMVFLNLAEAKGKGSGGSLTVKATLWSNAARYIQDKHGKAALDDMLVDGLKVCLLCSVTLFKDRGQISLNVEDLDPQFTKGALAIAREKLLAEMRAKGLDQKQKTLTLPPVPERVVLLSAERSRAQSDFLDQLQQGGYPGTVFFHHTPMQGDKVTHAIQTGLTKALKAKPDVIVITRGGGSAADLRWFDTKEVAYAIANCPVPVIAAIGHHDDLCVAEEIAFLRQKTPTAAADCLLEQVTKVKERLNEVCDILGRHLSSQMTRAIDSYGRLMTRLQDTARHNILSRENRLVHLVHKVSRLVVERTNATAAAANSWAHRLDRVVTVRLSDSADILTDLAHSLERKSSQGLQNCADHLTELEKQITRNDPTPWLHKGWTRLQQGKVTIGSVADIKAGDQLTARLRDGSVSMVVKDKVITRIEDKGDTDGQSSR